jgi:DNA-binding NtrC family response regulator
MAGGNLQPNPLGRSTLLVADGDRGTRESLRMILGPHHRVETISCADALLERIGRSLADGLVLDLHLPGRPAAALLRDLRREFPELAIVIAASRVTLEETAALVHAGVSELVPKPFDVGELAAAVARSLLAQRQRSHLVCFLRALGRLVGREHRLDDVLGEVERDGPLRRQVQALVSWTSRRMVVERRSRESAADRGDGAAPGSARFMTTPSASYEGARR